MWAERSSNIIMEPYLDEAVICNLLSMCVMAFQYFKKMYMHFKRYLICYICEGGALSNLATTLSRVLDREDKLEIRRYFCRGVLSSLGF